MMNIYRNIKTYICGSMPYMSVVWLGL